MVDFTKRISHGDTISWFDGQMMKQALLVYLLVGRSVGDLREEKNKTQVRTILISFMCSKSGSS